LASSDYYNQGVCLFKLGGNQLPEGDLTITPGTPDIGETVTFSADMSDLDGTVNHMVWRFGDGSDPEQTADSAITHEYSEGGTYNIRLTVVDNHGGSMLFTRALTVGGSAVDLCPDDPEKTAPGVCGCGVPDEDADSDGLYDCEDACPADADNDIDGDDVCGNLDNCAVTANTSQTDLDTDGLGDACDADADGDGYNGVLSGGLDNSDLDPEENPAAESGPAGDTPTYDGNGDGTPDADQAHDVLFRMRCHNKYLKKIADKDWIAINSIWDHGPVERDPIFRGP
jgi:PKD repeat protein